MALKPKWSQAINNNKLPAALAKLDDSLKLLRGATELNS